MSDHHAHHRPPIPVDDPARQSEEIIRSRIGDRTPRLAMILGSGLGGFAERLENPVQIPYADLPGFPIPTVSGHGGTLYCGTIAGQDVIALQGRQHAYEGHGFAGLKTMIRTQKRLGVDTLLVTCAAGSLNPDAGPGSVMAIRDHINLSGQNPLVGPNDDAWGDRFVPLAGAWDPDTRTALIEAASDVGEPITTGVYAWWLGPAFETPAEIQLLARLGANAVGMSSVPDCIIARHCGLRVVGLAAITNLAEGMSPVPISHDQTLAGAKLAGDRLQRIVTRFLERFDG